MLYDSPCLVHCPLLFVQLPACARIKRARAKCANSMAPMCKAWAVIIVLLLSLLFLYYIISIILIIYSVTLECTAPYEYGFLLDLDVFCYQRPNGFIYLCNIPRTDRKCVKFVSISHKFSPHKQKLTYLFCILPIICVYLHPII